MLLNMAYAYAHTFLGWIEEDALKIAVKAGVTVPAKPKRHEKNVDFRLGSHDLTFEWISPGLGSDETPLPIVYFAKAKSHAAASDDQMECVSMEIKKLANTVKLSKKFHFEFPDLPDASLHTVTVADPK